MEIFHRGSMLLLLIAKCHYRILLEPSVQASPQQVGEPQNVASR